MKEVLVILSGYKRDYFKEQIAALKSQQNVSIKEVVLWQNERHVDVSYLRDYGVKIINSDINFKFHGRFTIPLLFDHVEYTAIFDDDTIPGKTWLQNAIRCVDEHNCIAGQNGRSYDWNSKRFIGDGDSGKMERDTKFDFVGHCWVFRTEMIRALWQQKQVTYVTGEDIQFCLAAKHHLNVDSYCVRQTSDDDTGNLRDNYSRDTHASFRTLGEEHHTIRSEIFEKWMSIINDSN